MSKREKQTLTALALPPLLCEWWLRLRIAWGGKTHESDSADILGPPHPSTNKVQVTIVGPEVANAHRSSQKAVLSRRLSFHPNNHPTFTLNRYLDSNVLAELKPWAEWAWRQVACLLLPRIWYVLH